MPAFLDVPPDYRAPVIITEDGGGLVQKYIDAAVRYAFEKRQVAITGSCRSACMMALAVPNVCVTKNAEVSFHWAYDQTTNVLRKDVTNYMMTLLPDNIQASMKGKLKRDFSPEATLSGEKLIKLGINECQFTK